MDKNAVFCLRWVFSLKIREFSLVKKQIKMCVNLFHISLKGYDELRVIKQTEEGQNGSLK